jgi:hypothetical protein
MDALRLSSQAFMRKLEVYLRRLPLLTKVFVGAIVCTHLVKATGFGMIEDRWALSPGKMDLTQSEYPLSIEAGIGGSGEGRELGFSGDC